MVSSGRKAKEGDGPSPWFPSLSLCGAVSQSWRGRVRISEPPVNSSVLGGTFGFGEKRMLHSGQESGFPPHSGCGSQEMTVFRQ